jgi:hypothetical protein
VAFPAVAAGPQAVGMEAGAVQAPEVVVMQEEEAAAAQAPEAVDMQVAGVGAEAGLPVAEEAGLPVVVEVGIARSEGNTNTGKLPETRLRASQYNAELTRFQKRRDFVSWNRRSEGFSRW